MTTTEAPAIETRMTYHFGAEHLDAALAKVVKVNRRCAKLGLPGYTTEHSFYTMPAEDSLGAGVGPFVVDSFVEMVRVTVIGEAPRFAGWSFVGSIVTDEVGVTTVRTIPGVETVEGLAEYQAEAGRCQHCGTLRQRRATYLLRHDDDRMIQVGSTCIEAFLGVKVSLSVASDSFSDEFEGYGSGGQRVYSVLSVLALATGIVAKHGYVSRAAEEEGKGTATAELMRIVLNPLTTSDRELVAAACNAIDEGKAEAVLVWARAIVPGESTYLANLAAIVAEDAVTGRNIGILTSAIAGYDREQSKNRERAARAESPSVHVGEVGAKWAGEVTVTRVQTIESYYGVSYLVSMVTASGDLVKWFASNPADSIIAGAVIKISGKVKGHEVFNGEAQTLLTRCKVAG